MPDNLRLKSCLHQHGTALVFTPPGSSQPHAAVQIIHSQPHPEVWVALLLHKRAWGLFWAGAGWQRCRLLQERRRNRWASRLWRHFTEGVIRRLGFEADPDVLRAVLITSMAWAALLLLVVMLLGSYR